MRCIRCQKCKSILPDNGLANYCCGKRVSEATGEPMDLRGFEKMEVCRSNKCGNYDAAKDTCELVIRIGKLKKQNRSGDVNWLRWNPDAKCPNNPPMWNNADDTVGSGKDKSKRASDALERGIQDGTA